MGILGEVSSHRLGCAMFAQKKLMVCFGQTDVAVKSDQVFLFRLFDHDHLDRHVGGNELKAELVEQIFLNILSAGLAAE
jgi:hypothetical protein